MWRPPPDFGPVDCDVPGVWVYAPRSGEVEAERSDFSCPHCGAHLAYDVGAAGLACEHCGHAAAAGGAPVGRAAEAFEFTLDALAQDSRGWGVQRRELHCDTCGADLSLDAGTLSTTCPFCTSHHVRVRDGRTDELRPRHLVAFAIERSVLADRLRTWLGKGWMHPTGLQSAAGVDEFLGIYVPFWCFDARLECTYRAQVGTRRRDSEGRTRIDWSWVDGTRTVGQRDVLEPATRRLSEVLLRRFNAWRLEELTEYEPAFLAGWQALAFDIPLPDAWECGRHRMREAARASCRGSIRGSDVRSFSMLADLKDERWRYLLLPLYVAAYRYDGQVFQVLVDGQTGQVQGQKPVAWWRVWAACGLAFLPATCSGLLGLPLLLAGGAGVVLLIIGFILFVVAIFGSLRLVKRAKASEAL